MMSRHKGDLRRQPLPCFTATNKEVEDVNVSIKTPRSCVLLSLTTSRLNSAFVENVKLIVGQEKTEFSISKDLICSKFEFFHSACAAAGSDTTIFLPEYCPKIFSIFLA